MNPSDTTFWQFRSKNVAYCPFSQGRLLYCQAVLVNIISEILGILAAGKNFRFVSTIDRCTQWIQKTGQYEMPKNRNNVVRSGQKEV